MYSKVHECHVLVSIKNGYSATKDQSNRSKSVMEIPESTYLYRARPEKTPSFFLNVNSSVIIIIVNADNMYLSIILSQVHT